MSARTSGDVGPGCVYIHLGQSTKRELTQLLVGTVVEADFNLNFQPPVHCLLPSGTYLFIFISSDQRVHRWRRLSDRLSHLPSAVPLSRALR